MKSYLPLLALLVVMLAGVTSADDEYRTAKIVDAGQDTEISADLFGDVQNANMNTITVELDGMRITANYQTLTPGGKNASSRFIVGTEVQARVHNDKQLWIIRADGKPLKLRISRREMVAPAGI